MSSSTPFYQQLNARFIAIISLFFFIVFLLTALLIDRENKIDSLVNDELASIEAIYQQQVTIRQAERLLDDMMQNRSSEEMLTQHQQLIALLTAIRAQAKNNKRQLGLLLTQQQKQSESIKRLSGNHGRNEQLSQNAAIQMQLVIDELTQLKNKKQAKQAELYQQIIGDKVADRVTSSRAKAHALVTTELTLLQHTQTSVTDVFVLFRQLTLNYSLVDYDHFTNKLEQSLAQWNTSLDEIDNANEDEKKLLLLLSELQRLLYIEQSTVAKWRGHIRVAQEYASSLQSIKNNLTERSDDLNIVSTVVDSPLPSVFQSYVPEIYHPKHQYFLFGFYAIIVVIGAVLLLSLSTLRSKIRSFAQSQVKLVSSMLLDGKEEVKCNSLEQNEIVKQLSAVLQPKHSESDFQSLSTRVTELKQIILDEGKVAVIEPNNDKSSTNRFIQQVLFGDTDVTKPWRSAFTKQNFELIINKLKKAKSSKESARFSVENISGDNLYVSLMYKDGFWQGVIRSQPEQKILSEQLIQLENELVTLGNTNQALQQLNASQLNKMLVRAMLKSQNVSIDSGGTSFQVYRQLSRILDWSRQLEISSVLTDSASNQEKVDVNLNEELSTLTNNVLREVHAQRNKLTLHLDPALLMHGKVNVRLFHRMLQGVAKACLQDTFKSTLALSLNVIDKNAGQQVVKFDFAVHTSDGTTEIPIAVQTIASPSGEINQNSLFEEYMQSLLNANHCSNTQVSSTDFGFQLSFDMAIALSSDKKDSIQDSINLKEARFALLSDNDSLNQRLKLDMHTVNGQLESYQHVEHLIKSLTSKHLNAHPVSTVVIASGMINHHLRTIEQHLSTLAKPIRPKLMVLQPHFSSTLQKRGLYNDSDFHAGRSGFIERLAQFSQSNEVDNRLISPEVFKTSSFEQTQVEVLIATEQPQRYQSLSRILYWLGLQVTFVGHPQTMLKHWQSGRYLVLLSALNESPVVDMAVGKNISRGVISLDKSIAKLFDTSAIPKNWQCGNLPNVLDIDVLISLLKPWLKEHLGYDTANKAKDAVMQKQHEVIDNKESKIATLDLTPAQVSNDEITEDKIQVFDIAGYARNQGSPELAVYMLDTYLEDINDAIINIEQALMNKDFHSASANTEQLIVASKILTASELTQMANELKQALDKKSLKKAKQCTEQLVILNENLVTFSQAI